MDLLNSMKKHLRKPVWRKMKKIIVVVLATLLVLSFSACEKKVKKKTLALLGKWETTGDFFYEVFEFKSNGKGHNENDFISYDFKFEIKNGKLNIYQKFFGTYSDEPKRFDYSIEGDLLIMVDEHGTSHKYKKIS